MRVDILASGSTGNCTAVYAEGRILLLDCGLVPSRILRRLEYKLPHAILVTHEHGDHAKAVASFLKRGVEVYMTRGTKEAMGMRRRHNLRLIEVGEFEAAGVKVEAIRSIHDAAEPVNFILDDGAERLLYATDTGAMPEVAGRFTKILIETNYSEPVLLESNLEEKQKRRVLENHLSAEQAITFLAKYGAPEVHLIHISKRHGDGARFVERAKLATGIENIYAH